MNRAYRTTCRLFTIAALLLLAAPSVWAQCSDPSTHFRGGVWKQWILQIGPGPAALAAVQRVIAEMNHSRAAAALPLLVFDAEEPLVVGIIEENNPRGPDGGNLVDRLPNQEIFFATFAEIETGGEVVLFLTDPLRSRDELTAKGVPGASAVFERSMKLKVDGDDSEVSTNWVASNAVDRVKFSAKYASPAITLRSRFPGRSAYLACNMAKSLDVMFRSLPTQTFGFFERAQANALLDLSRPDVEVELNVRHHDADINAMFNDPANQPLVLFEIDRVVRIERQ